MFELLNMFACFVGYVMMISVGVGYIHKKMYHSSNGTTQADKLSSLHFHCNRITSLCTQGCTTGFTEVMKTYNLNLNQPS